MHYLIYWKADWLVWDSKKSRKIIKNRAIEQLILHYVCSDFKQVNDEY